jgi:hypothetical protein
MPAGKAIAMAAMPTAVLMGMGFTASLAVAANNTSSPSPSKSLSAEEYKDCVAALGEDGKADASPTPSPSESSKKDDKADNADGATPSPSATSDANSFSDKASSPDSGSDDKAEPTPSPSATASKSGGDETATPKPSPSGGGNLLDDIGDTITGIFTGGTSTASPSPTPSASASGDSSKADASDTVKDTTDKVTDTVKDTVKDTTDKASKAAEDTTKAVEKAAKEAADKATASPGPSASSTTDPEDCPAATDAEGGVDNKVPLPDDPWYLQASFLKLHGADYKGVVEVRTADGSVKKVLKFVVSNGSEIGDLHQIVKDKDAGKTYHVQAAKGSTSTITGGATVMYTESISGNLLGLVPLTFDPEHPPPLNLPRIYFTDVKVTQAGQFGGTLTVPGLHQYTTDGTS